MESHLTKFITYDPETHNTDRTRPAFDGDSCVTNVLYFCLKLKGEERKDITKFLDINYNYMLTMAVDLILG